LLLEPSVCRGLSTALIATPRDRSRPVFGWGTALAALKPLGGIAAGQTVLIHAAAGGTGQAAVTLAKHYGATVIAAASPAPSTPT
jgi:NADPH2:quinone reductase